MSIPKLKKIKSEKKYHDLNLIDEYAWVDQPNILEVLKDANKLDPEVKNYIKANNNITDQYFDDVKNLQKNLFKEIKSKIKLNDTSLKFKDKKYYYWVKTEAKGNYGKRIRQLIDGSKPEEVFFDGDLEKKNYGSEYFGLGSVSTSHCDDLMAYSLDLKGSEYYTIYLRDLRAGKNKRFDYKPRYYKGEGNPFEIKHKFDQFRSTTGNNKGIKGKITSALSDLKGNKNEVEFENKIYQLETPESNSNKIILCITAILVIIFLFIIDFDLSIFSKK